MNKILVILIMILLVGCSTPKRYARQLVRGSVEYRDVLSGYCGSMFPVKEKLVVKTAYRQGETIYSKDTVWAEVTCPPTKDGEVKVMRTLCPPSALQVDTLYVDSSRTQENTAFLEACTAQVQKYEQRNAALDAAVKRLQKWNKRLWTGLSVFGIAGLVMLALKIKKVIS